MFSRIHRNPGQLRIDAGQRARNKGTRDARTAKPWAFGECSLIGPPQKRQNAVAIRCHFGAVGIGQVGDMDEPVPASTDFGQVFGDVRRPAWGMGARVCPYRRRSDRLGVCPPFQGGLTPAPTGS